MFVLAFALVAVLIWVFLAIFFRRRQRQVDRWRREKQLEFELAPAAWSDRHVEGLLQRNPTSSVLLSQYVRNAKHEKDWALFLQRSEMFLTRAPDVPAAWLAKSQALHALGEHKQAAEVLRSAIRRFPRAGDVLLAWAREAVQQKEWPEAVKRFAAFRRCFPVREEGYIGAAAALMADGQQDAAEALLTKGMARSPRSFRLWSKSATLAEQSGDLDESVRRWERMRARFPAEPEGFLGGAAVLAKAGRSAEAAVLIDQARAYFPGNKKVQATAERFAPPPDSRTAEA